MTDDQAEALVARLLAANVKAPTSKRLLQPAAIANIRLAGDELGLAMRTLAANLTVAGALRRAYDAGTQFGFQWARRHPIYPTAWEPGLGKPFVRFLTVEELFAEGPVMAGRSGSEK